MYDWLKASQQRHYALFLWHQWPLIIAAALQLCIHLMERGESKWVVDFLSLWCN